MDYIILGLIICFCLIMGYSRTPLILLISGCFRYNISIVNEEQGAIRYSRNFLCFFIMAFFALLVTRQTSLLSPLPALLLGMSEPLVFVTCFAVLTGYFLIKTVLLKIIGWTIDAPSFMYFLGKTGQDYFILTGLTVIGLYAVINLFNNKVHDLILSTVVIIAAIGYLLYTIRCIRIFISARYSLFFWILYLCTLELVPFAILLHFVVQIK